MGACIEGCKSKRKDKSKEMSQRKVDLPNKPIKNTQALDTRKEIFNMFPDVHKKDSSYKPLPQSHIEKSKKETVYQNNLQTQERYQKFENPISQNLNVGIEVESRQAPKTGLNKKITAKRDSEKYTIGKNTKFDAGASSKESLDFFPNLYKSDKPNNFKNPFYIETPKNEIKSPYDLDVLSCAHKEDNPNYFWVPYHTEKPENKIKYSNNLWTQERNQNRYESLQSQNFKIDIQVEKRQAPNSCLNEKIPFRREREENSIGNNIKPNSGMPSKTDVDFLSNYHKEDNPNNFRRLYNIDNPKSKIKNSNNLWTKETNENRFQNLQSKNSKIDIQVEIRRAPDSSLKEEIPFKRDREENSIVKNMKSYLKRSSKKSGFVSNYHKGDNLNNFRRQSLAEKLKSENKYSNNLQIQKGSTNLQDRKTDAHTESKQPLDSWLNKEYSVRSGNEWNRFGKYTKYDTVKPRKNSLGIPSYATAQATPNNSKHPSHIEKVKNDIKISNSLRSQKDNKKRFESLQPQNSKIGIQVERRQAPDSCLDEKIPAKRYREENNIEKNKNFDEGKLKPKFDSLISQEDKKSSIIDIKVSLNEIPKKEEPRLEPKDYKSIKNKHIEKFNIDLPRKNSIPKEISQALSIGSEDVPNPVGLENLGNTCYMNSIIQCIAYLPSLDTQLESLNNEMSIRLLRLITSLKKREPTQLALTEFKTTVNNECSILNNSQPNDSKIFFSELITLLSPETHIIEKRFLIKIKYNFNCTTCQSSSSTTHKELHIQIDSDNSFSQEEVSQKLQRIIDISLESHFYCEKCCKLTSPENIIDIKCRLPETLLIYLGESQKNESFTFPLSLNLNDTKKDIKYSLRSVYNGHHGHATSVIKFNENWYKMDDENVTYVEAPYSKYAVLLFYQKK